MGRTERDDFLRALEHLHRVSARDKAETDDYLAANTAAAKAEARCGLAERLWVRANAKEY